MTRPRLAAAVAVFGLLSGARLADAALISTNWKIAGDNLLVLDTSTNREWLKLTETAGLSYDFVTSQLAPSGMFDGFQTASLADTQDLLAEVGVPTVAPANFAFSIADQVIDLFGITYSQAFSTQKTVSVRGITSDPLFDTFNSGWGFTLATTLDDTPLYVLTQSGQFNRIVDEPAANIWLWRSAASINEPATLALIAIGFAALVTARRHESARMRL